MIVGGDALKQLWVFIVAPLVGVLAAFVYGFLVPKEEEVEPKAVVEDRKVGRTSATP